MPETKVSSISDLIESLRRPIYNYNMSMHGTTPQAETRRNKAKLEIHNLVCKYAAENKDYSDEAV